MSLLDRVGGNTCYDCPRCNIFKHDRAGSDNRTFPDGNALTHRSASPYMSANTYAHRACQPRPSSNMHMITQHTIVLYDRTRINNNINTQDGARVDHRVRQ